MLFGFKFWVTGVAIATLAACGGGGGGGGGGSTAVASSNAFNVQSAMATLAANGFSKTFNISGSCTGSFGISDGPATNNSFVFEGSPVLQSYESSATNLFGCTNVSNTGVRYYDMSYMPVGANLSSGGYSVVTASTTPMFPTAAHVGDTAVYGHAITYTDSSKALQAGTQTLSYSVNADTATTAILNLISKSYNTSNVLIETEQDFFRISATGTLTPIAMDVQYANGSTVHLVGN